MEFLSLLMGTVQINYLMFLLAKTEAFRNKLFWVVFFVCFSSGSFMVWNVLSIELIQKLTPEKFVFMDRSQRLKSLVLIGFCNERAGVASGCGRAAERGETLSSFSVP